MTVPRTFLAAAAVAVITVFGALPASALNSWTPWGPSSRPLIAKQDNVTAKGYGKWAVAQTSDGTKYRAYAYLHLNTTKGNSGVFGEQQPQANSGRCMVGGSLAIKYVSFGVTFSCSKSFYNKGKSQTARHKSAGNSKALYSSVNPDWNADAARGRVKVCIDRRPLKKDACTGLSVSGTDSY